MKPSEMSVPVAVKFLRPGVSRTVFDVLTRNPPPASGVMFGCFRPRLEPTSVEGLLHHARSALEREYRLPWPEERVRMLFDLLVEHRYIDVLPSGDACKLSAYALELNDTNWGNTSTVEKLEPREGSYLDMINPHVQVLARDMIGRAVLGQRHLEGMERSPIGGVLVQLDTWGDDGDPGVAVHAWPSLRWVAKPAVWKAYLSELAPYGICTLAATGKRVDEWAYADVLRALVERVADPAAEWGEYEQNVKHRKHTAVVRAAVRRVLEARAATGQGPAPLGVIYVATCMRFVDSDPTAPKDAAHVLEALGDLTTGGVASYSTVDSHHAWALKPEQG